MFRNENTYTLQQISLQVFDSTVLLLYGIDNSTSSLVKPLYGKSFPTGSYIKSTDSLAVPNPSAKIIESLYLMLLRPFHCNDCDAVKMSVKEIKMVIFVSRISYAN